MGVETVGWALHSAGDTVTAAIFAFLALGPRGAFVTLALKEPSLACTDLGTPRGDPCLAGLNEATLEVFAVTVNSKHTFIFMQHIARLTEAALLAGGGNFRAGAPTEALWVRAGRETGGKAVGIEAVGRAFQSIGDTVTVALIIVQATGPCWATEVVTLNSPSFAGAVLGTSPGDPCLAFRDENAMGVFAATLTARHTLVITQHIVRFTDTALLAGGGGFGAGALTVAIRVRAGRLTGWKAFGVVTVGRALHSDFNTVTVAVLDVLALGS